ncbi:hypothetical protein [Pseudonocardia sp. H11422]|uniref:hypothetical protein n=1 Tax=Pseudonocardia sp. H11422 TaxID=2835866 RepID=UPI001BDC77C0|nr:hypothetical protein [Pseudonocardia sp. H11422]
MPLATVGTILAPLVALPSTLLSAAVDLTDAGLALQRKLWSLLLPGFGTGDTDRRG